MYHASNVLASIVMASIVFATNVHASIVFFTTNVPALNVCVPLFLSYIFMLHLRVVLVSRHA